ncbi:MAG: hypothetical protein ACREIC_28410, partial [Limisphaerales bacterium]
MSSSSEQKMFDVAPALAAADAQKLRLHASLHLDDFHAALVWLPDGKSRSVLAAVVQVSNASTLEWILRRRGKEEKWVSQASETAIRTSLNRLAEFHPITHNNFEAVMVTSPSRGYKQESRPCPLLPQDTSPWEFLTSKIRQMVRRCQENQMWRSPWMSRAEERREAEQARLHQNREVAAQLQLERERKRALREELKALDKKLEGLAPKPAP